MAPPTEALLAVVYFPRGMGFWETIGCVIIAVIGIAAIRAALYTLGYLSRRVIPPPTESNRTGQPLVPDQNLTEVFRAAQDAANLVSPECGAEVSRRIEEILKSDGSDLMTRLSQMREYIGLMHFIQSRRQAEAGDSNH